ncbi:ArgR [Schleiferilactobacillus shenzhenensis LY-73]|uniref:Arginine repressor n=2 Tax=Schleiferilactobacillus shenzhenensis TaxID=1231337 RepID=U4TN98_9LACO|nr:ArgR [Schleiferilactobacillus shenzhenensis LY-73]
MMGRQERKAAIRQLVTTERFERQRDLLQRLQAMGIQVSQGNLSRDMQELGVHKYKDARGVAYYAMAAHPAPSLPEALRQAISNQVLTATAVQFTVVLKTEAGSGNLVAAALDDTDRTDVVGTLAGHDTVLIICPDANAAQALQMTIGTYIGKNPVA